MRLLRILTLRARLLVQHYDRALRLEAMLDAYAAAPDKLSDNVVREVLCDVDAGIAVTRAELAALRRPKPTTVAEVVVARARCRARAGIWLTVIAVMAVVVVAAGCTNPAEESRSAGREFVVDKLFTVEGCTVYRFLDGGRLVYFTNCSGSTRSGEGKGAPAGVMGGRQV